MWHFLEGLISISAKFPIAQACVILILLAGWPDGRGGHPFEGALRVGQRFPRRRPGLSLRLWHLPAQALAGTHPATHHSHIAQLKRDAAPSMLRQRRGLRQHIRKSQQKHRPPGTTNHPCSTQSHLVSMTKTLVFFDSLLTFYTYKFLLSPGLMRSKFTFYTSNTFCHLLSNL